MASQADKDGESLLSFAIKAITEVEDEYLGRWLEQRLDTTMGPHPPGGASMMALSKGPEKSMLFQANLAADIGNGVALGLKALGGQLKGGQLQGPTQEVDEKTRFTDDDNAAVMVFSHVLRGDQVQPIWITLNNSKQKNIDVFRRQIFAQMM
jgi:hypothetical protein